MKHGRISALFLAGCMAAASQGQETRLKPGGGVSFANEDGSATLSIGGKIQIRHTYEENSDSSYFHTPRVEVALKGSLYRDWKWEFMADFAKKEKTSLKEAFVEHAFGEGFNLRYGQYKIGFDRQQLESSGRQTFAEASLASAFFGKGRDQGVQAHGSFMNRKIRYNAGVFNGTGEGVPNTNTGHMGVARVSLNPLGDFGMSQGDVKPSAKPLVFLDAAAYHSQNDGGSLDGTTGLAVAAGAKAAGAYATAEYFLRETAGDSTANGYYVQASYMLVPEFLELAARYAQVDPDADTGGDRRGEITGGFNVFFEKAGHNLKFTGDFSRLTDERPGIKDGFRTRAQFQLAF